MVKNHQHESEVLLKQLVQRIIEGHLEERKDTKKDSNGSFLVLDNKTLNLLLIYLLTKLDNPTNNSESTSSNDLVPQKSMDEIDEMIKQQNQEFEEIIAQLKEL
ncbi:hypothetical protein VBD025_00365 [Virgibacillus flavescens]|uniref:hypothetical protein n=1 Tax=Virgibacillus flavescens TaxID=1611422 RepID=UPI003D34F133